MFQVENIRKFGIRDAEFGFFCLFIATCKHLKPLTFKICIGIILGLYYEIR